MCDRVAIVRRGHLVALEDVASAPRAAEAERRDCAVDGTAPTLEGVAGVSGSSRSTADRLTCRLEGDVGPFLAAIARSPDHAT